MPFQKGHGPIGRGGTTKLQAAATRRLAAEVRERIPASAWVDFHLAIACGFLNVCIDISKPVPTVKYDDPQDPKSRGGVPPTLSERTASMNWLADRGHGLPVQAIHLEADLRATVTTIELPPGSIPLAGIMEIRRVLEQTRLTSGGYAGQSNAGSTGNPPARVIDATSTERPEDDDEPLEPEDDDDEDAGEDEDP